MSRVRISLLIAALATTVVPPVAFAQAAPGSGTGPVAKDAGKHFQRGVSLYNEADYRAALVEFRRAYEIAPNAAVLYNIGQTYYQLQNYAAALTTLQRYLTEAGAQAPHRREVEQTLDTLQSRVGKITISANLADAEITVDDELVGKSPLGEPQLVSIGRRKVTASHAGVPAQSKLVDVAAGDTVQIAFTFADPGAAVATAAPLTRPAEPAQPEAAPKSRIPTIGWVATGVLAGGAITSGIFAFRAAKELKDARNTFPSDKDDLDKKSSRVTLFAVGADVLAVAAIVTGVFTVRYQISHSGQREAHAQLTPGGLQIAGTF
jgi:tetratricopeptide (TPR) repeat protein